MDNLQVASDVFTATVLMQAAMIGTFSLLLFRKMNETLRAVNSTLDKIDVKVSNR